MLRTNNRYFESLNICVEVAKCGKYSQIHPVHSLLSVTKNDLSRLNNLFMVSFQLISMLSYAKNKQQMCWVTQHQCRSRQLWKSFTYSPSTLHYKNYLLWPNNLFMVSFELIRMSSYTKNKLQMCWVTQHQWRSRQNGKFSHIHLVHSLFVCNTKSPVLTERSIHGKLSTHKDVLLC